MKKLAIILSFLMLVPGAAFGLEMMNDSSMDDVTGQAGVSIAFDDVQMFINIERIAWIDADGFASTDAYGGESGTGGAVGIQDFQIDTLRVNAITGTDGGEFTLTSTGRDDWADGNTDNGGDGSLFFDYADTASTGGAQLATYGSFEDGDEQTRGLDNWDVGNQKFKALSIDATSQLPALSTGKDNNNGGTGTINIGGVLIGLPTMEISIPSMQITPAFYNVADAGANAAMNDYKDDDPDAYTYGTIEMQEVTFTTLSGWMEIAPH